MNMVLHKAASSHFTVLKPQLDISDESVTHSSPRCTVVVTIVTFAVLVGRHGDSHGVSRWNGKTWRVTNKAAWLAGVGGASEVFRAANVVDCAEKAFSAGVWVAGTSHHADFRTLVGAGSFMCRERC